MASAAGKAIRYVNMLRGSIQTRPENVYSVDPTYKLTMLRALISSLCIDWVCYLLLPTTLPD
jgi:hypothetical protein